jgi:digeranylgeranylglycerophospholipid reductase
MATDTDIVIVGAGPAGLSAARRLAHLDADFVLLCREKTPCEDKVCGGFMPSRAVEFLDASHIHESFPVRSIRMKFPRVDLTTVDFEDPVGINTSRKALGETMLRAVDDGSSHVSLGSNVQSVESNRDGCSLNCVTGGENRRLNCKVLIDTSGVNAVSIRSGLVRPRISNDGMGYAVQYEMQREESMPVFPEANYFLYGSEFSPRGYAWIFPRGHDTVVGTGGLVTHVQQSQVQLSEYLNRITTDTQIIEAGLEGSRIIKQQSALMPLAGVVKPSFSDHILLAGDAAGHCSPITGEGIYYSMVGGDAAAAIAAEAVKKRDFSAKFLSRYERLWTSQIGSDLKWGLWLQNRLVRSGSSSFGSRLLKSEKTTRTIAEMLVGIRSVMSAIKSVLPSYVGSKISGK